MDAAAPAEASSAARSFPGLVVPPHAPAHLSGDAAPVVPEQRGPGPEELSLAAELRGSALLFGLAVAVTAGVAAGASALLSLF